MTKRVAVYTRRDDGRQQQMCEDWAASHGGMVVRTYAATGDRSALAELTADLGACAFDCVVATGADRYDRRQEQLVEFTAAARAAGVEVFVVNDEAPLTGDTMSQMLGLLAEE